jgi:uncharacterized protein YjbI with pentapeptide repeats
MPPPAAGLPLLHSRSPPAAGVPGCAVYDCFGAGQQVAQVTFGGRDWRREPGLAGQMFGVFTVMRQLHELLWYLSEALTLPAARPVHGDLSRALDETERLTQQNAGALAELDVVAHQRAVNTLLLRASELARAGARRTGGDLRGADLAGKDLKGADLSGASLRGARLIGADLRALTSGWPTSPAPTSGAPTSAARRQREHLPHPVPARRGNGRPAHQASTGAHQPGALAAHGHARSFVTSAALAGSRAGPSRRRAGLAREHPVS